MDTNSADDDEKKKILVPDTVEHLLQGWLLHSHKGRSRHDLAARRYDRLRIWLGGAAAIVAAVVATSTSLSVSLADVSTTKVAVDLLVTISAILISISTFLNLAERADKHHSAGVRYKEIIMEIERVIISSSIKPLTGEDQSVISIQKNVKELETFAPVVSLRIYKKVEKEWNKKGIKFVPEAKMLIEYDGNWIFRFFRKKTRPYFRKAS